MQEETFQFQQQQVIEYSHRKILKPLQRKFQSKTQDPDEFYSTLETSLESNVISNSSKRGTNFSIEEEYNPRIVQNPLANELPNFTKLQYQLNHTIQQQPQRTCSPIDMFHNELLNQNYPDNKFQNHLDDCYNNIEDSIGEDYRVIQVENINLLQNFQNNIIENHTKEQKDKKQIPKKLHQDITKAIHKILIKK